MTAIENPLVVARKLAKTRFNGWTYGGNATQRKIDCVQFVVAVTEEVLRQCLNAQTRNRILISNLSQDDKVKLPALIGGEDDRIKGVQFALVSISRGEAVSPSEAQAGDFIQYWKRKNDGTWFGHAAILENVEKSGSTYRAPIFGSHHSTNGVSTSRFKLKLSGSDRKVFIVRVK